MLALLNPRLWIAAALMAVLTFSHFFVYRAGRANVLTRWQAATAAANLESFKVSERRQRNVDQAARIAAARAVGNRADAARSADALLGLRNAVTARRVAEESLATCRKRADTAEKLLLESGELLTEIARGADGHVNDVQMLLDAWPK
jgi:hypothetical protein